MQFVAFLQLLWRFRFLLLVLGVLGTAGYLYHKGYRACKGDQEKAVLVEEVKVREKNLEIRNNRADTDALLERLRSGSF